MMNLRTVLLQEHSRANTEAVAAYIGSDWEKFAALMKLLLQPEYRLVQRASWVVRLVGERNPHLLQDYLPLFAEMLTARDVPVSLRRNLTGLLETVDLPEEMEGAVMDACFHMLNDPGEAIAIRCSAMSVLARLSRSYPEIREEIISAIEDGLQKKPSPAFRARAKKVLQQCRPKKAIK